MIRAKRAKSAERGYVLLGVMLAFTLMLIALATAAPRIAQQIKPEREEELVHRGKDYATAIKRFVHKNGGRYPTSIEQLENTNHIRFLRKRYKDPTTGEDNWRMVHVGEAQIKIPTPNPGLNPSGNPGLQGSGNPGLGGSPGGQAQTPNTTAPVLSAGGPPISAAPQPAAGGQLGSLQTSGIGNGQQIGGGGIIGVASVNKAQSIKEFNDRDHYNEWFFVYDLRLEQSGGTGVTVAEPRAGAADSGPSGQQSVPQTGAPQAPSPPAQPPQNPQ